MSDLVSEIRPGKCRLAKVNRVWPAGSCTPVIDLVAFLLVRGAVELALYCFSL